MPLDYGDAARSRPHGVVLVSSWLPGEGTTVGGKTTVSAFHRGADRSCLPNVSQLPSNQRIGIGRPRFPSPRIGPVLGRPHRQELPIMTRRTDLRPAMPRAAVIAALMSLLTLVALAMPTLALFQDDQESQPLSGV